MDNTHTTELLSAIERGCNEDVKHLVTEVKKRFEAGNAELKTASTKVAHLADGIGRMLLTNVRTMRQIFENNDEALFEELDRIFTENEKTVKCTLEAIGVVFPK